MIDKYKINDGWIYVNGKRTEKYFMELREGGYKTKVWKKIYDNMPNNISELEKRFWHVIQVREDFYQKTWLPLFSKIIKLGSAHAKPTHKFVYPKKWWLYKADNKSIYFEWTTKPNKLINFEVGQSYYNADRIAMRNNTFLNKFSVVLTYAIDKFLHDYKIKWSGQTLQLNINNRYYWYMSGYNENSILIWKKLHWPTEELIKVNL